MRIEKCKQYHSLFILPAIGIVMKPSPEYKRRIGVAWLYWRISIGIGRADNG